jgi:hypothetical protein
MMLRFATLALTLGSLATPLAAQSRPDFSGKWTLDTKASEGSMLPVAMTVVVTQDAKTLKVENTATVAMGEQKAEQKTTLTYNLDGSVAKNMLTAQGMSLELLSTGAWDGRTLVITTKADLPGGKLSQTDHWTMAPDGKSLKLTRDVAVAGQQMPATKLSFIKS